MKKLILSFGFLLLTSALFAQSFISPIGFVSNETNKQKVISFIKKQVKEDYSKIGMDDPATLRMMENENLNAFKKLTTKSNTTLLRKVIKTYCDIGMCNYSTILMMYEEQNKASKETLKW
tara:strand:+ start:54 stop:413 length:360 start_codon:yes stop_codon:yes gene_type:complete